MKLKAGFTLIELLIAVAIVGILSAIAIPSLNHHILKGHRSDAYASILKIQLAEERYRGYNTTYGNLSQVWGGVTSTEGGRYTMSISNVSATSYTITATAVSAQSSDSEDGVSCAAIVLSYSAGTATKTPANCW